MVFAMLSRGQLAVRKAVSVGSLSKHDLDGSENVIWKLRFCNHFSIIQSHYAWKICVLTILELNWNQRLGQDKIEHLSSYAHVVQATAKKVISRHRKNENAFKMSKEEKCTCKACKNTVFHCQICKFVEFLLPLSSWLLSATRRTHCFCILNIKTPVPFGRTFPFDNCHSPFSPTTFFWNRCIYIYSETSIKRTPN